MTPRHPAHRSDPCAFCRRLGEGDALVHVSLLWPERKRGWVCAEHVEAKIAARLSAGFALAREALVLPGGGDSRGACDPPREG